VYEKPQLNRIGAAEDVILGLGAFGNDLDTTFIIPTGPGGFASDFDED
jgi:hypothetical protein